MSVVDLHPEDLLDRDARGELTAVEHERLERHLMQCEACRVEQRVRADFRSEDEAAGEDCEDFDVQQLLSEVLAPGADRTLLRSPPTKNHRAARQIRPVLLAAASLFVAGVAAAAGWTGIRALHMSAAPSPTENTETPAPAAVSPARNGARGTAPVATAAPLLPPLSPALSPEPFSPEPFSPEPFSPEIEGKGDRETKPLLPRDLGAKARRGGTQRQSGAVSPPPAPVEPPPEAPSAATVFAKANAARRAGDHVRAEALYGALLTSSPESAEALESRAALGRMLLEDEEAAAALEHFDRYLQKGGPLAEDVMADRAEALARLGRSSDEAAAWKMLVQQYPSSVHVGRAKVRLAELGER